MEFEGTRVFVVSVARQLSILGVVWKSLKIQFKSARRRPP